MSANYFSMPIYHLDYETTSTEDLKKVGAYRYAEKGKVLIFAIARDDGPVYTWDVVNGGDMAMGLYTAAVAQVDPIYAHNAQFEIAISQYCMPVKPLLRQWHCTAAMCRRAAIPASLAKAAEYLGLQQQKDTKGAALIRRFSIKGEQPGGEGWDDFVEYCRRDVEVERELHKALHQFDIRTDPVALPTWELDKTINSRGVPVNIPALRNAEKVLQEAEHRGLGRFTQITGLQPTQRDKFLTWVRDHGYPFDNLQAVNVTNAIENHGWEKTPEAHEALVLREQLSYAAVKKVDAMLRCANDDGRVRGTLVYHGAGPGRWSGSLIQPQNFKRPTVKDTKSIYRMVCDGYDYDDLNMVYGNPVEAIANCIRHFIDPVKGRIFDADYAAIEARIVCWLANQQDALEDYRRGIDRYKRMASIIFSKPINAVTSDERFIGKGAILGCGYGLGAAKFYENTKMLADSIGIKGVKLTPKLAEHTVNAWRESHGLVVKLWYACERAARMSLSVPGKPITAGVKLVYMTEKIAGNKVLTVTLPSGRKICYQRPRVNDEGSLVYYGQVPGKAAWGDVYLYGGKLVENVTQGVAVDIMSAGACEAERRGHEIFTLIHDQALAHSNERGVEDFVDALKTLPDWAGTLPLEAEGKEELFYVKG